MANIVQRLTTSNVSLDFPTCENSRGEVMYDAAPNGTSKVEIKKEKTKRTITDDFGEDRIIYEEELTLITTLNILSHNFHSEPFYWSYVISFTDKEGRKFKDGGVDKGFVDTGSNLLNILVLKNIFAEGEFDLQKIRQIQVQFKGPYRGHRDSRLVDFG